MKKLSFALFAVIIICACATTPQQYRLDNNHYEDLRYGFNVDLPNNELWEVTTGVPREHIISLEGMQKHIRLTMINESFEGAILVLAISVGEIPLPEAMVVCYEMKETILEDQPQAHVWKVEDSHLFTKTGCFFKFDFMEANDKVVGNMYIKLYRVNDATVLIIMPLLVSLDRNYGVNYSAYVDVIESLSLSKLPPSRVASIPGAPPQRILLELASQVEHKPYTPEVLSDPVFQSVFTQCEQQGGTHCRERTVPANSRTKFVRTQDDKLFTFVKLGGVERDRDYAVRFRLFDPDRNMRSRMIFSQHIPSAFQPDATADYTFIWTPPDPTTWQLGKWRIEIAVNGQVEIERTFLVVDQTQ